MKVRQMENENVVYLKDNLAVDLNAESALGRTGQQYHEAIFTQFDESQRSTTTILVSGLTVAQDRFFSAYFRGQGYNMVMMDVPDNDALRLGKEFGNRGQCNPTYFTVGNLVKFLVDLRDHQGLSSEEIVKNYVYIFASACGPCRFGSYITEYRKALRDSGFEGFRVISASQTDGYNQTVGDGSGLVLTPKLFVGAVSSMVMGDVLNALMYRIRPYEITEGETNIAIEECRSLIEAAMETKSSLFKAMWQVRKRLQKVQVDRSKVKPKVAIIGEFWAMTTEGDGNYKLQAFLESEGAEVDVQLLTAWMHYLLWQAKYDTDKRSGLKQSDNARRGLKGVNIIKRRLLIVLAEKALMAGFKIFSALMGLKNYKFADMKAMAVLSQDFYDNDIRGGEGHMEVGKLILNAKHKKVNMTLSVKPFGCMPSSGVSDGVQSKITELYPNAIFLPIETTGDGAVNVYSRIQMQLFKAKQQAQKECDDALAKSGMTHTQMLNKLTSSHIGNALHHSPHKAACTAASTIYELA